MAKNITDSRSLFTNMGVSKRNSKGTNVDNIDIEILKILLTDARENQKSIAKKCGITAVSVLRRIKRLEAEGVIVGTGVILNREVVGSPYEATILIDACNTLEEDIKNKVRQTKNILVCAESIGRYNLCALIVVHDLNELNETVGKIRNIKGVNTVNVNIWTGKRYGNFAKNLKVAESQWK
jgi:Lrp/AsnC family transcriptional regulator for asnA, asnC and gidA